jgi:2-polyprenyl-3-methyl-5-hydroxy-6-metoxy-1,4-benzoquinol methylase
MFPDFSKRSSSIEIMDDLNCSGEVLHQTLRELDSINHFLGGNTVTLQGLNDLLKINNLNRSAHVIDIGCGSGEILKQIAKLFRKTHPHSTLIGIDANKNIAQYAHHHVAEFPEVSIIAEDILGGNFRAKEFDIALATLFLHHFSSSQLIDIFRNLKHQARIGIVINDLHRHWLAYYSIKLLTTFFSRSSMVKFAAPLSVLRSFTKKELIEILKQAGIENYSLKWKWAFRWQLIISHQKL